MLGAVTISCQPTPPSMCVL